MPAVDGTLTEWEGRPALRFERSLAVPPARVWTALVDPADTAAWHPTPFDLDELAVGAAVRFRGDDMPPGEITAVEAGVVLAYTWDTDHLLWELAPEGDGTRLTLVHAFDDRLKAARDASGWHICLDGLAHQLGEPAADPAEHRPGVVPQRHVQLNSAYERKFGIDAGDATPIPDGYEIEPG